MSRMDHRANPADRLAQAMATSRAVRAQIWRDLERAKLELPRRQRDIEVDDGAGLRDRIAPARPGDRRER
jgi:hypothetical protein